MSPPPQLLLFLTFDYEVFLGRNFLDDEAVLFRPTDEILEVCRRADVPATLFADVCSAWAHQDAGHADYVRRFEEQLRRAVAEGHDVQLHLHPHWMAARRVGGEWRPDPARMTLDELGLGPGERGAALVERGARYLRDLLLPVDAGYRCVAYRAGALALGPDESGHLAALTRAGIEVDSSVAKGLVAETDTVAIDYRATPAAPMWRISPERGVGAASRDGILEVPIATFHASGRRRLGFLIRRALAASRRRGSSISRAARQTRLRNALTLLRYNARYLAGAPIFLLSCDTKGLDLAMLLDGLDAYVAAHPGAPLVATALLSHPKLMFAPEVRLLADFIDGVRRRYGDRVRFARMRDAPSLVGADALPEVAA